MEQEKRKKIITACGILITDDCKVFLVRSSRSGKWILPGSKIEERQTFDQRFHKLDRVFMKSLNSAVRINRSSIGKFPMGRKNSRKIYDVYRVSLPSKAAIRPSKDTLFLPLDEVTANKDISEGAKKMIKEAVLSHASKKGVISIQRIA